MPVKWDSTKDAFMFLYLFSAGTVSKEKCQEIISAWPDKFGEAPTIRAIQEHVTKLKSDLANQTGVNVGPKVGGKNATPSSSTPRGGPRTPKTPKFKSPTKKRKIAAMSDEESDDQVDTPLIKREQAGDLDDDFRAATADLALSRRASLPRGSKNEEKQKAMTQALMSDDSSDDEAVEGGDYKPEPEVEA